MDLFLTGVALIATYIQTFWAVSVVEASNPDLNGGTEAPRPSNFQQA